MIYSHRCSRGLMQYHAVRQISWKKSTRKSLSIIRGSIMWLSLAFSTLVLHQSIEEIKLVHHICVCKDAGFVCTVRGSKYWGKPACSRLQRLSCVHWDWPRIFRGKGFLVDEMRNWIWWALISFQHLRFCKPQSEKEHFQAS